MAGLVVLPLIAQAAILHDGWRAGWLAVGAAVLVIGFIPNWLLMVRRPEDVGLVPDRRTVPHAAPAVMRRAEPNYSRAQALRTPSFWLLCLFTLFAYPVQAGVSLHQAPFLIERGLSPTVAAAIVSTFSLMSGVASLGFGFFPRSLPIRYALALSGIALSVGTFVMLGVHSPRQGFVAGAIFGIGIGGLFTLLPIAWADYYGRVELRCDPRHCACRCRCWRRHPARCCPAYCATGRAAMICRCDVLSCCPVSAFWRRCSRVRRGRRHSKEERELAIKYEKRDGVAYITLNNPAKANIFDKPTSDEISAAWIDLWEDRDIRCAILTGAGDRHFCGGHNLAPRPNITEEEREYLRTNRIFWPLAGTVHGQKTGVDGRMGDHYPRVWKPVIGAVNGWAAGAGLYVLLSSTDIRIASAEHARFKFSLISQGWLGHGPGASLLVKQLRYADAMKILLTDDPFDAQEALRIGLVNEVVPHAQLMERAEKIARHIVTLPPVAVRMMKEFVVRFGDLPTDQAWHVQNLINNLLIQVTTDGEEGRQAFNEKRPPNFTGALRRRGEVWEEPSEEDAARLDEAYRSGEF